jgi:hypothetical protein
VWELLDAVEDTIAASDPVKREALTETIDAYCKDFPEEFYSATGEQAPMLLGLLVRAIDTAWRPESVAKPRPVIRLIDRKPDGNA